MLAGISCSAAFARDRLSLDAGWRFRLGDPADVTTNVTYYPEISDLAKRDQALLKRRSTHAAVPKVSAREVDHLYLPREFFIAEARRLGWRNVRICDHADLPALAANPLASYRYSVYAGKAG